MFDCPDLPVGAVLISNIECMDMNEIQNSIEVFDRLRKNAYRITIENGMELWLHISREHYHHLAGFQHLTDMETISNPISRQKFFGDLKKGKIRPEQLEKSTQYHLIHRRIASFRILEQILSPGSGRIIVEFDKNKTGSVINTKFHLFHRTGDPFKGEAVFYTLFLNCERGGIYYPVTYVVENSNMYVREQTMYECTIECVPLSRKKELVPV